MAKQEVSPVAKQLWGLGVAFGVVSILFGILALFWPGLTVALFIVLFSVFVLVWGIVGLVVSLASVSTEKFWWLELIFSLLAIGLAVYMLRNPAASALIFVFYMGLTFLARGVVDIIEGLFDGNRTGSRRLLAIVLGVIGILAGIVTLLYPVSAGLAVVWVVGLYGVLYGSLLIGFSLRIQNELQK